MLFKNFLNDLNRKPSKIWVDKDSKFYNSSMKSWLEKNDIEMYSRYNEVKSVIAKRFIRTFKKIKYININVFNIKKWLY